MLRCTFILSEAGCREEFVAFSGVASPGHTIALESLQTADLTKSTLFRMHVCQAEGKTVRLSRATCEEPRCLCVVVLRLWEMTVFGSSFSRSKVGSWEAGAVIRSGHCEVIIILCDGVMSSRSRHIVRSCARRGSFYTSWCRPLVF